MTVNIIRCVAWLALIGASGFVLGRLVPKDIFHGDRFPFRPFRWEREGAVYNSFGIRRWKEKLPDMSVILPKSMPSKKMPRGAGACEIEVMVRETCVAEATHALLSVLGFGCAAIWRGIGGWIVSVLYFLGNLPFIMIQRYNRPKLMRILQRARARECINEKSVNTELQHGTGT